MEVIDQKEDSFELITLVRAANDWVLHGRDDFTRKFNMAAAIEPALMLAVAEGNESDGNRGGEDSDEIDDEALTGIAGEDEGLDQPLIELGWKTAPTTKKCSLIDALCFPDNHLR